MSRGYSFTHSPITDATGGDPTTGTVWNDAFEDAQDVLLNVVLAAIDLDVQTLFDTVGVDDVDTLTYSYKDTSTITVAAGVAAADDGTQSYTVTSATDVDCSSLGNSKNCYVWIGEDSVSGDTELEVNDDPETAPANLLHSHRLKYFFQTDGSGDVVQFAAAKTNLERGVTYPYNGKYRPLNCLWEDGSSLGKASSGADFEGTPFQNLYVELEDTWGGTYNWANGDTVNLPDSRGRALIGTGQGSGLTNRSLGDSVGEEAHALTSAENGPHNHSYKSPSTSYFAPTGSLYNAERVDATTGNSGSGTAHNTMQPSAAKHFIIPF